MWGIILKGWVLLGRLRVLPRVSDNAELEEEAGSQALGAASCAEMARSVVCPLQKCCNLQVDGLK